MEAKKLPSEALKLLACLAMLLDHCSAVLHWSLGLRVVGRVAFPIYCFLLVEGAHHTGNPGRYAIRLGIAMVLSELPFDLAFRGRPDWGYQSVMVTLLLGFGMLQLLKKGRSPGEKLLLAVPFLAAAEWCRCDYGAQGVAMVLLFGLAREYGWSLGKTALGLAAVSLVRPSIPVPVLGISVPLELFSLLALLPISLYSGEKATGSRAVQRIFYLFYPAHLAILAWLS